MSTIEDSEWLALEKLITERGLPLVPFIEFYRPDGKPSVIRRLTVEEAQALLRCSRCPPTWELVQAACLGYYHSPG